MQKIRKTSLAAAVCIAAAASAALSVLLCIPGAALIAKGILPMETSPWWAVFSAGLAVMISASAVAKGRKRQALPTAGLTAACMFLTALALCGTGGENCSFGPWVWQLAITLCSGGILGALLSVRQNPHGKKRRRSKT